MPRKRENRVVHFYGANALEQWQHNTKRHIFRPETFRPTQFSSRALFELCSQRIALVLCPVAPPS